MLPRLDDLVKVRPLSDQDPGYHPHASDKAVGR